MPRFLSFHNFGVNEDQSSGGGFTIDQIRRSILDNEDDDIADVLFVGQILPSAIFLSYKIEHDSGSAEIDSEVSEQPSDYSIDYDKRDLFKFFRNNLTPSDGDMESPEQGPKFSLNDIVEAADKLLAGGDYENYIDNIDSSDVFVDLMAKESKGNEITIQGFINDDSMAKIGTFLHEKFYKDLVAELISNITGYEI